MFATRGLLKRPARFGSGGGSSFKRKLSKKPSVQTDDEEPLVPPTKRPSGKTGKTKPEQDPEDLTGITQVQRHIWKKAWPHLPKYIKDEFEKNEVQQCARTPEDPQQHHECGDPEAVGDPLWGGDSGR